MKIARRRSPSGFEGLGVARRYVVEAGGAGGVADGRIDVAVGLISTSSHESGRIKLLGEHWVEKTWCMNTADQSVP